MLQPENQNKKYDSVFLDIYNGQIRKGSRKGSKGVKSALDSLLRD